MLAGIKSIFFSTELEYPPFDAFRISHDAIRKLYVDLSGPGGYRYENIDTQATPPFLSTRRERGESRCEIGSHKIVISEKNPQMPVDEFAGIVKSILGTLGNTVPPIFLQKCRSQITAQPSNAENSVELLAGRVARVTNRITPFGRPPIFFGVRFRFLPYHLLPGEEKEVEADDKESAVAAIGEKDDEGSMVVTPEDAEGFVDVRFESFAPDMKSVWIQGITSYQLRGASIDEVAANIIKSHKFLSEKCKAFLDSFDMPPDGPEGGTE